MIELIKKTREYLDYLEEHYNNVQSAWRILQSECKDMRFISDDYYFGMINMDVLNHDKSKLSAEEFTQYRQFFFTADSEKKDKALFNSAWEHHKLNNMHHWQTWSASELHYSFWEMAIVHNVIDWMAMGMKFGDSAKSYYEANKDEIDLPDNAIAFMYEIFDRISPSE